ncbi:MAG: amidohydrolase [Clostridia bacterium]|nr:amidohydrolase [Clostridia bacterium]
MDILRESLEIKEKVILHRRAVHKIAEIGMNLEKTVDYVIGALEKIGCKPHRMGKAGVECIIGKNKGECVLLRADMDALPIKEETKLDFKCEKGNMHACGHDMHTAMLLGCAEILKKHEDELRRDVKLMFQGGEELLMGARDMIKEGILDTPPVKSAGMIHLITDTDLNTGTVICPRHGACSPMVDLFEIEVKGKGTHGAMAREGADPINTLAHIAISLHSIVTRETGMNEPLALTLGGIHCGRYPNVIPEKGYMSGSVRSYDEELHRYAKKRIEQMCDGVAKALGTEASVNFFSSAPSLLNDKRLTDSAVNVLSRVLGREKVILGGDEKSAGSEDFAVVSHSVPSVMLALMAGRKSDGYKYPLHHPKTDFDENALPYGTSVYVALALEIL